MKIQTGTPAVEGRYVVFVRCASQQVREWAEPIICTWHGGKWHGMEPRPFGWIGPIPPMRIDDVLAVAEPVPSYDL